jgi:hypothetical protein
MTKCLQVSLPTALTLNSSVKMFYLLPRLQMTQRMTLSQGKGRAVPAQAYGGMEV